MYTSVQQSTRRASTKSASFIQDNYKRGYKVPGLPYQEYGIITKELWVKYNSRLRIIPGHDSSTGALFKQNIDIDQYSEEVAPEAFLSDTFFMCRTLTGFGEHKSGVIIDLPPGSQDREMFDRSPLDWFQMVVASTVKNGKGRFKALPCWSNWVDNRMGTLPYPKTSLLFQALAFMINDRGFEDDSKKPLVDAQGKALPLYCLIVISQRASWTALAKALVDPIDPGADLDPSTNNKYGAMAEAKGNVLYLNSAPQPGDASRRYLRPSVQSVEATASGGRWNKEPMNVPENFCKEIWVPWDNLLRFYTASEQLALIAAEFGADTVNYMFKDNSQFSGLVIPDYIAAAGLGRYDTSTSIPGIASRTSYAAPDTPMFTQAAGPSASFMEDIPEDLPSDVEPTAAKPAAAPKLTAATDPELFAQNMQRIRSMQARKAAPAESEAEEEATKAPAPKAAKKFAPPAGKTAEEIADELLDDGEPPWDSEDK